jgi:hypothetical protein
MPVSEELKAVVNQMPDPDKNGTYADMDDQKMEQIEKVVLQLRKGGRDAVIGLIDMLVEPGKGNDIKAHFVLHLLAVRATAAGEEKARAELAVAIASQLGGDRPKGVQKYLIEQLQLAGGKEITPAIGKALLAPDLCDTAVRALAAIREGAAEQLLAALPKVQGRSRLSVLKKLGVLRIERAADAFKQALADGDSDIRIAGAWGIARVADASGADALLKCAEAHEGWERVNQTDACLALADALLAAGKKDAAAAIYAHLEKTRTSAAERHVREAAQRGLAAAR